MKFCQVIKILHFERNIRQPCGRQGKHRYVIGGKEFWYCDDHAALGAFAKKLEEKPKQ